MSNLQPSQGVDQGSQNTTQTNNPQSIGVPNLQPTKSTAQPQQANQRVLGIDSLTSGNASGVTLKVATSTGSNATTVQTVTESKLTPQTEFALPPWVMIGTGILVVLAGISFIWSQRNDMNRLGK